ncbi:MAG: hypothetical protein AABZ60_23940 [Planctomycetota bacterium]
MDLFFQGFFLFLGLSMMAITLFFPQKMDALRQKIRSFLLKKQNSKPSLFLVLEYVRQKDFVRLNELVQNGISREDIYNTFAHCNQWEEGAVFAKQLKDMKVYSWFMKEQFLGFLSRHEGERALLIAEQTPGLEQETYQLFTQLVPEGKWLKRGELAMKAGAYLEAFQAFRQGNEFREAVRAAVFLNSLDLLLKLAEGKSKATIKVMILDILEELKQTDLREQLIRRLKPEATSE